MKLYIYMFVNKSSGKYSSNETISKFYEYKYIASERVNTRNRGIIKSTAVNRYS